MMNILLRLLSIPLLFLPGMLPIFHLSDMPTGSTRADIQPPQLKWQDAGCYNSWCETGWYSSPSVADLDKDGKPEVIGSAYSIWVLDGATGEVKWRMASGSDRSNPDAGYVGRTWPGIAAADLDGNGDIEIITAHSGGVVSVYDHNGYFKPGWPKNPTENELRSLAIYDLEGDGDLEIIIASTNSQDQWYVYEHNGDLRGGTWPQHYPDSDDNGYTAGCYNQNVAAGDLDGDGRAEIIGPNDTHYLAAFHEDGSQVLASTIYGTTQSGTRKVWSRVGVHVDHAVDLRGYAYCGTEHRPNFAHSAPIVVDVNSDGILETVIVGNVYNCGTNPYTSLYEMPYILNADRTRWAAGGFDWTSIPIPDANAAPLSEDYDQIENNQPNPAAADLDGDGNLEILYASYDGRVHAFWLDKTEHGSWPFSVTDQDHIYFASEPVIADLDDNGLAEVIFTSWAEKGSYKTGTLYILDYLGNPIYSTPLPSAWDGWDWNGGLPAPTLADIDGDPDLEIVINTAHTGLVAYDLPGTSQARILWGTGRGNYQRSGSILQGNLSASTKQVEPLLAAPGDSLHYTITLRNPGPSLNQVELTDDLPDQVSFAGGLVASSGTAQESGGVITWSGEVPGGQPVVIQFDTLLDAGITQPQPVINTAILSDGTGQTYQRQAVTFINGFLLYFPQMTRQFND